MRTVKSVSSFFRSAGSQPRGSRHAAYRKILPIVLFVAFAASISVWRWQSLVRSRLGDGPGGLDVGDGKSSQANVDGTKKSVATLRVILDDENIVHDRRVLFGGEGRRHFQQHRTVVDSPSNVVAEQDTFSKAPISTAEAERGLIGERSMRSKKLLEAAAPLQWNRSNYLPIDSELALEAFRRYEVKQAKRAAKFPNVTLVKWGDPKNFKASQCLRETPECEFFLNISCPVTFRKCCAEHFRLKTTLFYVLDVAEKHHLQLFLDSGTLLSSWRDGGDTLVPWETDIDLGIVGNVAGQVADPMTREDKVARRRLSLQAAAQVSQDNGGVQSLLHFFQPCSTTEGQQRAHVRAMKKDVTNVANAASEAEGGGGGGETAVLEHCNDAHYVYFQPNASLAKVDTCRVEIWPFGNTIGDAFLLHPTRSHLNVPAEVVLPLSSHGGRCRMWGRACMCPRDPERYLDQWYPDHNWRFPQTIHWNENNAPAWRS